MTTASAASVGTGGWATLASMSSVLGEGIVRLVAAPVGLDVEVDEIVLYDGINGTAAGRGDLLLAVGVDPGEGSAVHLVVESGNKGLAGVLVRYDQPLPDTLITAARGAGVALLVAPRATAWGVLHTMLRNARYAGRAGHDERPLRNLFRLADALAAAVGGAVCIEDDRSAVLAYSSGPHPTDQARQRAILGRRVPHEWTDLLRSKGVFRSIAFTDDVIRLGPLDELASAPRFVIGVRAGGICIGSIWVQEGDRPFGADCEHALREAAALAAPEMFQLQSAADLARRRSGEKLRDVLDGRVPPARLCDAVGVPPDGSLIVVGVTPADADHREKELLAEKMAEVIAFSCDAFRRKVVAAANGAVAYAVIAAGRGGAGEARDLAADLRRRLASHLRLSVHAAAIDAHAGAGIDPARRQVDLALRVQHSGGWPDAVHVDDVRAGAILLQLRDVAHAREGMLAGVIPRLEALDPERAEAHLQTLRAYLDSFGDGQAAASSLGVHPNTFRYRLRRLCQVAEIDLSDPRQRLVTHLQLHLRDL